MEFIKTAQNTASIWLYAVLLYYIADAKFEQKKLY